MTAKQIEKETKQKLKDCYTKEDIYSIFHDYEKELYLKNNIQEMLAIIRFKEKFYK